MEPEENQPPLQNDEEEPKEDKKYKKSLQRISNHLRNITNQNHSCLNSQENQ